jgi:D-alanyl-D-alanine carboxypeptidase/D-alanyl-D-alanine-endopeptidase (penicillin-binding protein 4)
VRRAKPLLGRPGLGALLAACLLAAGPVAAQNSLPAGVAQALRSAQIPLSSVAVVVQEVGAAAPLVSHNAAEPMNPASVMKLVTTYAALESLGPAFRWRTEVYLTGSLSEGVLSGNLYLKGRGDPKLTLESFWRLLREVRERGVRELRGDLVLDRSFFGTGPHDPGRFDAEPLRPYNVGPDALLLNFKAVRFQFIPEPERQAVRVIADPRPESLEVINVLRLANGACGNWRERLNADFRPETTTPPAGRIRAVFTGSFAESCGEKEWNVSLFSHPAYIAGVFRQIWEELGGRWSGTLREERVPAEARLLYGHESPPLVDVVRDINKFSNNVMARQLYLTLGAELAGAPARPAASMKAVQAALALKGLDFPELVIENGSGLSRIERISAANVARLLAAAWRSAVMPELVASLPLAAVDGTLRRRLKNDPIAGQAHVKTGSLHDARSIAGYVLDRNGQRKIVVMIVNHGNAGGSRAALEALLAWAYDPAAQ